MIRYKVQNMLVTKAFQFASEKHKDILDDAGKPSINHPWQVAKLVSIISDDSNLIAAAYLHDTIEDTKTTYEELVKEFNEDIANLVKEVTHIRIHGVWKFPNLKTRRGIILKFADRLSNLSRMETWDEEKIQKYLNKSIFWEGGEKQNDN